MHLNRMPSVETKYFGTLPCAEGSIFDFPCGLPGFEDEKTFVVIEEAERAPLVFLQSIERSNLCFVTFPIQMVDQDYELGIAPEDLDSLGLDTHRQPVLGAEITVLVLLSTHDTHLATANLMAPIVLNVKTRRGLQAIRRDSRYSHVHSIGALADGNTAEQQAG